MVIKNAKIIDAYSSFVADVLIEGEKIAKIGKNLQSDTTINADNLILMPGAIDLDFFLNEPGNKSIESLEESIQKAALGGITHIVANPCTKPVIDNELVIEYIQAKLFKKDGAILDISAAATKENNGKVLSEQSILLQNGALSCEINSDSDSNILRRTFEYSLMQNKTLFVNLQNKNLEAGGVIAQSQMASILGLPYICDFSQASEIAKISQFANAINSKTLIKTVSTKRSINALKNFKPKNLFASTSINHLLLDVNECDDFNTLAKTYPPLEDKTKDDLLNALKLGIIDTISSSHKHTSKNQKDMPFDIAEYGISNANYFLPLVLSLKEMDLSFISRLISYNPAKIMGFDNEGLIKENFLANLVLIDPNKTVKITDNSIYKGYTLKGKVEKTIIKGKIFGS